MANNLIEALEEWADAQPDLAAQFPGGIYNSAAPTGPTTLLPYLTFAQADSRQQNVIGAIGGVNRWVQYMTVNLEARSYLAADARIGGTLVRDRIVDDTTALIWPGGSCVGRYLTEGEGGELEEGLGPDGSDVWVHRIPIVFTCARG